MTAHCTMQLPFSYASHNSLAQLMLTHSSPVHTYTPLGLSPWVVEGPCGGTG